MGDEQQKQVCGTCPFTRAFAPDLHPGGSPLEVYVAQHFMPFRVPCHERVDYDNDHGDPEHGWKEEAVKTSQCVGFAQCRNGGEVDEYMPDVMLKSQHDLASGAFKDVWDFYAHHMQISRWEALMLAHPVQIGEWCAIELDRPGKIDIQAAVPIPQKLEMAINARAIASKRWLAAIYSIEPPPEHKAFAEFKRLYAQIAVLMDTPKKETSDAAGS